MTLRLLVWALALTAAVTYGSTRTVGQEQVTASECSVARLQAIAPAGTTITGASLVAANGELPAYCRVDGHAASPGNTVNFRLGLPANWNGKFYFQGVGGLGGSIGSLNTGLARGYASASTDTGHASNDPTWGSNRAKEIDYGHRGTHVTAVAAKALTEAYYRRAPAHAYFNGCSNGGRQALMEVQRYPEDFDGIVAGHPATGTPMQLGRALVYQHLLSSEANYLPAAKVELLDRATLAACDATDGLNDGLVSDPRACTFKPETLQCRGADGADCLTAGQVETVQRLYAGIKDANGSPVAYGFPVGHEGGRTGWTQWIVGATPPVRQADGTFDYTSGVPSGFRLQQQNFEFLALDDDAPGFSWRTVRYPQDMPRLRVMSEILSPTNPDLGPYQRRGGKIILYHGWADPGISAYGTLDYFEKVVASAGGQERADAFARLFLAPGVHHCGGGPGPGSFDMLTALEAWVEQGRAPTSILATRQEGGQVVRTRPLCAYPMVARYQGNGSPDDAANFTCAAPPRR